MSNDSDLDDLARDLWEFVYAADYEFTKTRPRAWYLFGHEKAAPAGTFDRWKASREVRLILERHHAKWSPA